MRLIDANALKEYIDAQKGRLFIGCTIGEALKMIIDEQPTIEPGQTITNDYWREIRGGWENRPEGNMKLIDPTELKRSISVSAMIEDGKTLEQIIDSQPTIEERKKGKWIKYEERGCWHCSECGTDNYYAYVWNGDTGSYEFQDSFCPSCGADMRG